MSATEPYKHFSRRQLVEHLERLEKENDELKDKLSDLQAELAEEQRHNNPPAHDEP